MDIIRKDKYNIIYNHYNEHIFIETRPRWFEVSKLIMFLSLMIIGLTVHFHSELATQKILALYGP